MVVPYAETDPTWVVRSAFDVGEYRFGWLSTRMYRGNEVPQNALLLDALLADDRGKPTPMEDVIALYERDGGILWRHYDFNNESHEGRRSRELVMTTVAAVNHQHFLNFRLDFDVDGPTNSLAEMNVKTLPPGPNNPYGNAFTMETTPLTSEAQAVRDMRLASSRTWVVTGTQQNSSP